MSETRFQLDEDSICYGCSHVENATGACTCESPCVGGSMNDYDDPLKDESVIGFINKVGSVAKTISPGQSTEIPCDCGGTLIICKSGYNGHIHARCDKCDKTLMQ